MERLTIPDVRVDEHTVRREMIDVSAVREHAMDFYWRLKAYEDTGMTPEELQRAFVPDALIKMAAQALGTTPERLRELAAADKEGRVVVLPCKVGDTVYLVNGNTIMEFTVVGYSVDETGISWVYSEYVGETGHTYERTFLPEKIGETTFLTREEAEREMAEMKREEVPDGTDDEPG